jgi:DNA-binding transcriptional ArsR family regulator
MKLDMDLVRKILIALEEHPHGFYNQFLQIDGYSQEQIGYHITLMEEAGLLLAVDATSMDSQSPEAMPQRLTWQGHQFLNACRDEGRWAKAKTIFKDAGGVSFDVAKEILVQLMLKSATTILSGGAV